MTTDGVGRTVRAVRGIALALLLSAPGVMAQTPPPAQGLPKVESANILPKGDAEAQAQAERQQTQPLNNAPVWREVRSGESHYTSVKGRETGVLVQPSGDTWRAQRNNYVIPYGSWALVAVFLVIALYYWIRGPIKLHSPPTGRKVRRFSGLERTAHWTAAISFCILAVSGLVVFVGKYLLLPIIGPQLFAWLTQASKLLHNFVGPVFGFAVLTLILIFVKDNIPSARDALWLKKAGGLFSGEHVPSGRFNAGEKVWFWIGVVVLALVVVGSGFFLLFPNFDQTRVAMQNANLIHAISAVLMMCFALGHIYMGTLGTEGAYQAMRSGEVDETWAKEHHEDWYREVKANAGSTVGGQAAGTPVGAQAPHEPRRIS